ncbi:MAG: DNA polymerase, partial [Acidobacteriota bacterium]
GHPAVFFDIAARRFHLFGLTFAAQDMWLLFFVITGVGFSLFFVTSLFGRRRYFPSIKDRNFSVRSRAEREAINMPIQGTASDIVKIAMLKVHSALKASGLKTQMIMQVHDELLFEAPESEVKKAGELIKREMEAAAELDVPLVADIGSGYNWMDAK